jgi:hypothetical protein
VLVGKRDPLREGKLRISVIVLLSAFYSFCQPASAQSFKTDYDSLVSLEKDFSDAEEGVRAALQGKFDGNAEYRCVYLVLESSSHLKDIFVQYKFSVAIGDVIKDHEDREKVGALLKTQTDLMRSELERYHRRLKNAMTICSTIPLAVTKATELLTIVEKGEAVVKSIADKL